MILPAEYLKKISLSRRDKTPAFRPRIKATSGFRWAASAVSRKPRALARGASFLIVVTITVTSVYALGDKALYYKGKTAVRRNQLDFAFTYFDMIVQMFPDSDYYSNALFAKGEYVFLTRDYSNAKKVFSEIVMRFDKTQEALFSCVYLLHIANKEDDQQARFEYEKKIITFQQLSFLFRDSKELSFTSAFSKNYKAVYYIDKVEVYIDEELFATIPF